MASRKFKEKEPGTLVEYCGCPLTIKGTKVDCGSSDAGRVYLHEDGSHSFSRFSCKGSIVNYDIANMVAITRNVKEIDWEAEREKMEEVKDLIAVSMPSRKLSASDYEEYGVVMALESDGETVDKVYYPSYRDNEQCGLRIRSRFKEGDPEVVKKPELLGVLKNFRGSIGDVKKGIEMFGQHLFPAGGKHIIICCGEEDTISARKMFKKEAKTGTGYPCVGTPSGESVAGVKPHLKYLSSFERITIIPDSDSAGKEFCDALCKILPVGKVHVVKLPK